jgi:tripartite-type tricarboxylate transporter receptor subunit TctC
MDAVAGHVDMTINFPVTAGEFIKSGRLIPLMQSGATRLRGLPDVPTAQEVGYPELAVVPFGGFWVPSKTSPQVLVRLNAELLKIFRSEEFKKILEDSGSEPHSGTPEEFAALLESERARWADIIKKTGVHIEQ